MTIPESTTNMQNPYAAEKRVKRLEIYDHALYSKPLGDVLQDFRERTLPPVIVKPEPILQVCLPMTYSEYTAVTGFLAEYRERFKARENAHD